MGNSRCSSCSVDVQMRLVKVSIYHLDESVDEDRPTLFLLKPFILWDFSSSLNNLVIRPSLWEMGTLWARILQKFNYTNFTPNGELCEVHDLSIRTAIDRQPDAEWTFKASYGLFS